MLSVALLSLRPPDMTGVRFRWGRLPTRENIASLNIQVALDPKPKPLGTKKDLHQFQKKQRHPNTDLNIKSGSFPCRSCTIRRRRRDGHSRRRLGGGVILHEEIGRLHLELAIGHADLALDRDQVVERDLDLYPLGLGPEVEVKPKLLLLPNDLDNGAILRGHCLDVPRGNSVVILHELVLLRSREEEALPERFAQRQMPRCADPRDSSSET
eukprot:9501137-Pyramimonas_sp.AAC.1